MHAQDPRVAQATEKDTNSVEATANEGTDGGNNPPEKKKPGRKPTFLQHAAELLNRPVCFLAHMLRCH